MVHHMFATSSVVVSYHMLWASCVQTTDVIRQRTIANDSKRIDSKKKIGAKVDDFRIPLLSTCLSGLSNSGRKLQFPSQMHQIRPHTVPLTDLVIMIRV